MNRIIGFGLACASLCAAHVAHAQDEVAPATDHSGVDDGQPDEGNSWKYFVFHKDGVSAEVARADMIECRNYAEGLVLQKSGSTPVYSSVPYSSAGSLSPLAAGLAGGIGSLVGSLVVSFMNEGDRRAMERSNLRKCFAFKNYDRYEIDKDTFKALHDGESDAVRTRLVEIATGTAPEGERLVR
ncbi:MAG: hypothetical protein WA985_08450 [Erythrobacter sp.]|uniref:hypothetical protein n=1 Tax=Erythrobacter sp. TaxID=1042 RepID=UPI003C79642E